jgi:hypothetical protein
MSDLSNNIIEDYIYDKLNDYSQTHPNLTNVWRKYLQNTKIMYLQSLVDCDNMIRNLNNSRDVSLETIALLYALLNNNLNI